MPADPRAALAAAQRELLAALVAGAQAPPGFDAGQVRLQAGALLDKRARGVSSHHPWLVEALGVDYLPRFTEYARGHPRPAGSSGHADALAFEAFLRDRGELPRPRRARVAARFRLPGAGRR
jgi:hypothetical protein